MTCSLNYPYPTQSHVESCKHRDPMNHEFAIALLESIKTNEAQLKQELVLCAVRYARLRTDWQLSDPEGRCEMAARRTAAHNTLIDAANILSRTMLKAGEDTAWRRKLGDDRKEIGDWACHVQAHLGILAR